MHASLKVIMLGKIIAAIGRDLNDQIFPIAFAIVEGETKGSWSWFLSLLISDLECASLLNIHP